MRVPFLIETAMSDEENVQALRDYLRLLREKEQAEIRAAREWWLEKAEPLLWGEPKERA